MNLLNLTNSNNTIIYQVQFASEPSASAILAILLIARFVERIPYVDWFLSCASSQANDSVVGSQASDS